MSIDYTANYGIGYQVESSEAIPEGDLEDGLSDYLYAEIGDGFDYFELGNHFSGDMRGNYLIIKKPFDNGLDLTLAKERLDAELSRLKLVALTEFNEVGGLTVW